MAWESVRVLDSDFPVGYTENDYYFTGNRSASHSGSQGGFSDITFVLSFSLRDSSGSAGDSYFYNQPAGDYYLVGDSNAGIFVRKTGGAQSNSGQITVKASYNGQADSGSSMPENLSAATAVRSGYSGLYMQFSIICGINEETHKGTIFTYRKWNGWIGRNDDYQIRYCDYGRYTDSEVAYNLIKGIMPVLGITSNGGGATHIAKVTGQLKDLSSNLSDILMVSGGGGGGLLVGETDYTGKEAGGISGSGDNSADQTTGNAFGQGESGTNISGGGSGLYGGYKGTSSKSGGAGSGYIGNSLLSNKKMVGYNVPTSSAEGTKTESVNEASESPVSGKPKSGNGFARIKFLRNNDWRCLTSIKVNGINCPLLQINDFSIIPNTYAGAEALIRRQSVIYTPSGVSDLGSEFAQPTISSGTVEKSTNYNNVIFRTTFGYNAQAYSNFNQNEIIYNTNTILMSHGFLLATEANTRLYIGIALNDTERYGCCYFVAQYPDRNWTTENYSGGDGEIGYLIYSIFGNS